MAWDTTDISKSTIYQDGTLGFLFIASGNIERGQCVSINGDDSVVTTSVGFDGIGVCDHKVYHNDECCIYSIGNIVQVCSPEEIQHGNLLYASSNGFVSQSRSSIERPIAISVSDFTLSVTNYVGNILLI